MTSLCAFLTGQGADTDVIHHVGRYYLSERTDDLSPQEMRAELMRVVGDPEQVEAALWRLATDTLLAEEALLAFLSSAWEEPDQRPKIEGAVHGAKKKLAIIETGLLALVALYGLYLLRTGGVKRTVRIVERQQDGTFREVNTVEYWSSKDALSSLVAIFSKQQ